jgi:hypothetical protein
MTEREQGPRDDERDDEVAELQRMRRERARRVEAMLHDDIARLAPGNAIYWLAVVGGAFLLNLALLVAIAR